MAQQACVMHASLLPLHAERFPGVLQLQAAHMHDHPRTGRVRAGDPLRRRRPTGSRSTSSYPPDPLAPSGAGRRDWGACALHGAPWPTPAGLLRREIPAGMPGFDGRGGGARHGWVRPDRASSGLERAPPRLIPEEDDRCFPLFAVASPFIPEGGCQRDPAAPLLERPCPQWA